MKEEKATWIFFYTFSMMVENEIIRYEVKMVVAEKEWVGLLFGFMIEQIG